MDNSRIKKILGAPCLIEQLDDLYYLTGMDLSKGRLFVSELEAILFVDGRYYEFAKRIAPCKVCLWDEQKKILPHFKTIGFDSAALTFDAYLALKNEFPMIEWTLRPSPLKHLRMIKDQNEIAALKKAANLTWRGYQEVVKLLKVGISEEELALEFEIFCRRNGASGLSFEPIIAFGENSAYPHHRAGKTRLRENQLVLIDVGAIVDHYHGDMTRIAFFGNVDKEILRFERIVKDAQRKAVDAVRPGIKACELDRIVRDEFDKQNVKQLYIHSLGHGIGLETHEHPRVKIDGEGSEVILEPGMVFTIEPGLYKPGLGGIRIEDMVLVTETGYENFFAHG